MMRGDEGHKDHRGLKIPESRAFPGKLLVPSIATLVVLGAVLTAYWAFNAFTSDEAEAGGDLRMAITAGSIVKSVSSFGTLAPRDSSVIVAEEAGVIVEIGHPSGAWVETGEDLFVLSNPELVQEARLAEIRLLEAQAERDAGKARLNRELVQAQNAVEVSETELRLNQERLEMLQTLSDSGDVSRLNVLEAEQTWQRSQKEFELSRAALSAVEEANRADQEALKLRLRIAEERLASSKRRTGALEIKAPKSGRLSLKDGRVELGTPVTRNQVLASLMSPETMYARLRVAASRASELAQDQHVVLDVNGEKVDARVAQIGSTVVDGYVTIEAALVDPLPEGVRANTSITATIRIFEIEDTKRIPLPADLPDSATVLDAIAAGSTGGGPARLTLGVRGDRYLQVITDLDPGTELRSAEFN